MPAFQLAAVALWAVKACRGDQPTLTQTTLTQARFAQLAAAVMNYQLKDPIAQETNPGMTRTLLRVAASQFEFDRPAGDFGRAWVLWHVLPSILPAGPGGNEFDFLKAFRAVHRMSPLPFIKLAFMAWTASENTVGFTRGYFTKAREDGFTIPGDQEVRTFLEVVAAIPKELAALAERYKCADRRFAPYDFNPLLRHPIVRPWAGSSHFDSDGLLVPVGDLIPYRVTSGVHKALFSNFKANFSEYFGRLFEHYVGMVLSEFPGTQKLIPESSLRRHAPHGQKVPDWCLRVGDDIAVFECKATFFNRSVLTSESDDDIDQALRQVKRGVGQVHGLIEASKRPECPFPDLKGGRRFFPVVVTWEHMPLVSSVLIRERFLGSDDLTVISIAQLEALQQFAKKGVPLMESLELVQRVGTIQAEEELFSRTGAVHGDSFLSRYDRDLFASMHIDDSHLPIESDESMGQP